MKQSIIKYCKSFLQNIRNFSLSYTLKDKVYRLEHEINELSKNLEKLEKRKRIVELKNENLTKIESYLKNTKNINQSDLEEFLKEELTRLHKILENHMSSIEKSTLSKSKLINIELPTFIPSSNPFGFLKNYLRYRKELKDYKDSIQNNEKEEFIFSIEKDNDGFYVDKENHSSYKAEYFKETNRHLEVGGKLKRMYYLADIPAYLSPYVFFRLLTSSLPFRLSTFVEPASSGELLKKARQRLSVLEMQQNERIKIGKIRDQQIDKNIDEVMSFIDELVHEAEKGIVYSLYLQLEADTEEELTALHKQLQNISESMDLTFNQYTFGHKQAFKNFMPFVQDHLKENRILQSTAVSYLMPFVSKQLSDPDGIFLGVNAYNDSLVFIDPFTSRNNNINILGVSGSGKSVTAKVLMNRLCMRGVQIIAIDPEGEYTELAKKLGGEVIQFSRENGINPFYINSSKENDILDHISTLKTFFKFFIPDNHYDSALLDEKLTTLYDSRTPDFENFLALLGDNQMAKDLSILSTGSLRGIFNSKRKLELDNDVIILDLHDLKKDEKRDPAMYLLTSLIWNLINKNTNSKRMLFIDEAHKLLVDKEVAIFYRELVKQARKRNVGIISITQDVEDFLNNEYGKAIVTNSETKILLKQSYATLAQIGTIYPMTDEEKQQLGHLGIGEIVLFRENEHIRLNIVVLPFEKPLTFTN